MKKYFITGLLIWIPLVITLWVLKLVVDALDQSLLLFPVLYRPDALFGIHIPGFGVVLTLVVVLLTGVFAANFIGERLVRLWHDILHRIPVVNTVYSSVKQVSDTLFSSSGEAFRRAVLVQYPRPGSWTIAFVTGQPGGEVANHLQGEYVSVYVPTTPNPTSGFFLMMPKSEVIELDMSVDAALKYVISMGVVVPSATKAANGNGKRIP